MTNLRLTPPLPPELLPGHPRLRLVRGGSRGRAGDRCDRRPVPEAARRGGEPTHSTALIASGIRVGIIARETGEEAWRVARERFPEDRKGQITHELAMKVSDSQLAPAAVRAGRRAVSDAQPVLARPVQELQDVLPVPRRQLRARGGGARPLHRDWGSATFILDIPREAEELHHTELAFVRDAARRRGRA